VRGAALIHPMSDIEELILRLRLDLCRRFGFDQTENRQAFLNWLITSGTREYKALADNPAFRQQLAGSAGPQGRLTGLQHAVWLARPDVQQAHPLPDKLREYVHWFYFHGVGEHAVWPFLSEKEQQLVLALNSPWQAVFQEHVVDDMLHRAPPAVHQRPWGVNLIGYAYGQLGIGEDARMAAKALLAAGVPFTMLNFKPGADIPQNDLSMAQHVSDSGPYAVNMFCMTALEHGRYYAENGSAQLANRYNIGYWPWELGQWPVEWQQLVRLVDEVWVSTQHTFNAVAPLCQAMQPPVPVHVMPMAVELGPVADFGGRHQTRKHFGLPAAARLFCFSFDLNSSIHRKNPQTVVDAFLRAFPAAQWPASQVGLVIKVHPPKRRHAVWERLKALAATDKRLHVIEQTLPRPELLALYQACDCFVSLHRAEGFGRGIAEALLLGLHVITTGYSGNVDFCRAPAFAGKVDLVRYRLVKVRPGQYPFGAGQVWANADAQHAAQCMLSFVTGLNSGCRGVEAVPATQVGSENAGAVFSASQTGQRYAERLQVIAGACRASDGTKSGSPALRWGDRNDVLGAVSR
jgi:glycosyltransferase involved in cell wall biosynthesis